MNTQAQEVTRYIANGLIATAVNYGVLTFNLNVLSFHSAGLANLVASIFGITISFLGSRYFVFRNTQASLVQQAIKFSSLYGAIAVLNGLVLLIWTDWSGLDYRTGFLLGTAMQVILSFFGNKLLVFRT